MVQKCHTLILLNHFYFKRTTMVNREIKIIKTDQKYVPPYTAG